MIAMATHEVVGGVAVIRTKAGSSQYIYKGGLLDADAYTEESVAHALSVGLIREANVVEAATDDGDEPYKGVTVADLKAEIEKRNKDREDADKISVAEPGNRPELVAALVADDAKQ